MNNKIKSQDNFNWIIELKSKIHAEQTKVALTIISICATKRGTNSLEPQPVNNIKN